MSNEEIAVMIQQGRKDLVPVLWEQVERFVRQQAARWAAAWERAEFDDLYQSGIWPLSWLWRPSNRSGKLPS